MREQARQAMRNRWPAEPAPAGGPGASKVAPDPPGPDGSSSFQQPSPATGTGGDCKKRRQNKLDSEYVEVKAATGDAGMTAARHRACRKLEQIRVRKGLACQAARASSEAEALQNEMPLQFRRQTPTAVPRP